MTSLSANRLINMRIPISLSSSTSSTSDRCLPRASAASMYCRSEIRDIVFLVNTLSADPFVPSLPLPEPGLDLLTVSYGNTDIEYRLEAGQDGFVGCHKVGTR